MDRWGKCRMCGGKGEIVCPVLHTIKECGGCDGSGFSGSADDWYEKEYKRDLDKESEWVHEAYR